MSPYQNKPFLCKDSRLITRASSEKPGLGDYVIKRDWRRDFDKERRREGYDYFWPISTGAFATNPGDQPFPNGADTDEPITLVVNARHPNGENAVIVATKTTIYRFIGNSGVLYVDAGYVVSGYISDASGLWLKIGSGFSADGHRWEALSVNGYLVLNNGVDLPMTYRLSDDEVKPIHELREQAIASVGTIGVLNGILMCGDIREIKVDYFEDTLSPAGDIESGEMVGSQSGTTVTTQSNFFSASHVGRTLVWSDGTIRTITVFTGPTQVTVNSGATITEQTFTLRNKASQVGETYSGLITGSVAAAGTTVTASGSFFTVGMNGSIITFSDGFTAALTYVSATQATLSVAPTVAITALPFWISGASSLVVTADADAFTADMVGLYLLWDSGEVRKIVAYTNAKNVTVDDASAIPSGYFRIENPDAYAPVTEDYKVNRIHYRVLWGIPDEPRRFGAVVPGNILAGSRTLTLEFPVSSIKSGDEIIVVGAGEAGGILTATVDEVSHLGKVLTLSEPSSVRVIGAQVMRSDAHGSIVGYEDLQGDSSGILRMLPIDKVMVVYKDTTIYTGIYTGDVTNPFIWKDLETPDANSLFYRWTLISVGGDFHLYAGVNSFYRFDLTSRVPQPIPVFELCSNLFFDQVSLAETDEVFACDCVPTSEIWIQFPSASADKGLCFDYRTGSMSTTGIAITAAATVKEPNIAGLSNETQDWFVMGGASGTVLKYGMSSAFAPFYYRRSANPFSEVKGGYESRLKSGLESFGQDYHEKDLRGHVPILASSSANVVMEVTIYGARNPSESPTNLLAYSLTTPSTQNLIPMFYRHNYFQDEMVVTGMDNPVAIVEKIVDVAIVGSRSNTRRP